MIVWGTPLCRRKKKNVPALRRRLLSVFFPVPSSWTSTPANNSPEFWSAMVPAIMTVAALSLSAFAAPLSSFAKTANAKRSTSETLEKLGMTMGVFVVPKGGNLANTLAAGKKRMNNRRN